MCQAEDGQERGQGAHRGEEVCQARVSLEQDTSPEPGHVQTIVDGPVPEEPNKQPSQVPSSDDVTVPGVCEPTVGDMSNVDGVQRKVCAAQLSVRSMRYVSEQNKPISRKL